jgi:uncharacterized repeat protein (TIGR01451 family)
MLPHRRTRYFSAGSRYRVATALVVALTLATAASHIAAQVVPGKNVNMVAGTDWPGGDPFLQRQNEPSIAVSSRNDLHLLAGANDYRTVDLPGLPETKPSGDAWLGVFKSLDGGQTWTSTLLPGYPQDPSNIPTPLRGFDAGADPVVRAGSNGLFYYSGIAFERAVPIGASSAVRDGDKSQPSAVSKDKTSTDTVKQTRPKTEKNETGKTNRQPKKQKTQAPRAQKETAQVRATPEAAEVEQSATSPLASAVFVSTFMDLNNRETGDPIAYVRTTLVDSDAGARFLDKQWIGVDVPRANSSMCSFQIPQSDGSVIEQSFPGGRIYVAYTAFTGPESDQKAQILLSYSRDCGATWSYPRNLSHVADPDLNDDGVADSGDLNIIKASYGRRCGETGFNRVADINQDCVVNAIDLGFVSKGLGQKFSTVRRVPQGATIAIHPLTGAVYVAWREFRNGSLPDVIQFARSTDFGVTFTAPTTVSGLNPFDQGTSVGSFRSNAFPTIAADADRIYLAWASRGYATTNATVSGESRIVMSTSTNGIAWSAPYPIDEPNRFGHQLMPSLSFGAGKLSMVYYDLREDVSQQFGRFVDEIPILTAPIPTPRHTMDVRLAQANPGSAPVFQSTQLSEYAFGVMPGTGVSQQLTFNPPNLTLFRQGTVPFVGDYIDLVTAPTMRANADGTWAFNIESSAAGAGGYAVWTDSRNVRAGVNGDLTAYTPPNSAARGTTSTYDPSVVLPQCVPTQTGTRNQDIFSARFDSGLLVGALGNSKTLGEVQRGFALMIRNTTTEPRSYRLTILDQPVGGQASFRQFDPPLTVLDVSIPRLSSVARTAYVTSTDPTARVTIEVSEISAPGAPVLLPGGLRSSIVINGDPTNPAIENPAIENPDIENKDIQSVEVYNPRINPAIENPAIENPAIENPAIENPAIENVTVANQGIINPAIENPAIENPAIENPAIENPAIENTTLANGSISDTTWELTNDGNTAAVYSVKLLLNQAVPNGILTQLIIHKPYTTPAASPNCELKVQLHNNILVNITTPAFAVQNPAAPAIENPAIENPAIENPAIENATVALAPGETVFVTVRAFDPDKDDEITFSPAAAVTPAAVSQSVNTDEIIPGQPPPAPPAAVSTTIAVPELADAIFLSGNYGQQLYASVPGTWSIVAGQLPPGVNLSPAGLFSGVPTTPGTYNFTVQFTSFATPPQTVQRSFTVTIAEPLAVVAASLPDGVTSFGYTATVTTQGGVDPRTWAITQGALPPGVSLDPNTGLLTGTPTTPGTFNFTVQVTDSALPPNVASQAMSIVITALADIDRTWAGVDNDWSNPANWTPTGVPGPGDDVLIVGPATVQLTANVAVRSLFLRNGATIDTGGFTLTVNGDLQAGNTIIGDGAVVMTSLDATVQGAVSNFRIAQGASVTLTGPLHITGNFTHEGGLSLSGFPLTVDGSLVVPNGLPFTPGILGNGAAVTVGGLNVASLVLDYAPLSMADGTFIRFDNVQFQNFPPHVTRLTIAGPGTPMPLTLSEPAFIGEPTTGFYIRAVDTAVDANTLTVHITDPFLSTGDGPSHTAAIDGAMVIWATQLADLAVTQQDSADPVAVGGSLTYSFVVTNNGPDTASGTQLIDALPPLATFVPAGSTVGCVETSGVVNCTLGDLASGASVGVSLTVTPGAAGTIANVAQVFSATPDPNLANNQAVEQTTVTGVVTNLADLSIIKTHSPPSPVVGENLTFTLTVTNHGPAAAAEVSLTDTLPDDVTFVSTTGSCGLVGVQLSCELSNLPSGASQSVTVTVIPTVSGIIENTASVTSLAVPDPNDANNVAQDSVLVGTVAPCATPIFVGPTFYSVGSISSSLVVTGDFNEDGNVDVVSSSQSFNQAALLLGDGSGALAVPQPIALPSSTTAMIAVDVNHDDHLDLVLNVSAGVHVMLGDGLGNFAPAAGSPFSTASVVGTTIEEGLFNADTHLDVVVGSSSGSNVALLLGDGNGGFGAATAFPAGPNPFNVIVGDYDRDSRLDVAVPNTNGGTIAVLYGDGLGGLATPVTIPVPNVVGRLREVGDVNEDGWTDLAVTTISGGGPNNLMLLLNDQNGGFGPATEILGPVGAGFVQPGDFNGDGAVDLAVVGLQNGRLTLLYGDGTGVFPTQTSIPVGLNQNSLSIADLNDDGRPDIVGSRGSANNIYVLLNTCGSGAVAALSSQVSGPSSVAAGSHPTYTVTVTNAGPAISTGVVLTEVYPNGMLLESATGTGVTCNDQGSNTIVCTLPDIPASASVSIDFSFSAFAAGMRTHHLMVIGNESETDVNDNSTSFTTTVTPASVTYAVTNSNDSGPGSLRQAIINSNLNTGSTNQIHFNVAAGGGQSIALLTALPAITNPVVIDGWTQPGFSGAPLIELNGAATPSGNGLIILAGPSTVRGLVINRFKTSGIALTGGSGHTVQGNYIGTNAAGTAAAPNSIYGIAVEVASNIIGGTGANQGNLVSGNAAGGIVMGFAGSGNQVIGNRVGTNASGTAAIPNSGPGVQVIANSNNTIGGPTPAHRNLISGGGGNGVSLRSGATGNLVQGNYIGTDPIGNAALPNLGGGVNIGESSNNTVTGNVISGNGGNGVTITAAQQSPFVATGNVIAGNLIGTNAGGTAAVPNGGNGVFIGEQAASNRVGGTTDADRNVISGNTQIGVAINNATMNGIQGNYIGTDVTGNAIIANRQSGVDVFNTGIIGNFIGGTATGAGNLISGNGSHGNFGVGVHLSNNSASTVVQGNRIGTNAAGTAALPNANGGIQLSSSNANTIGGTTPGAGNLISGNGSNAGQPGNVGEGVGIFGNSGANNVQGNLIGTNGSGTAALPNTGTGIAIAGANNTVGGTSVGARNLISGNGSDGVYIFSVATGSVVQNNFIGTDISGQLPIPNFFNGVAVDPSASNITVGTIGAGNIIALNSGAGIRVADGVTGVAIRGNSFFGNGGLGIDLRSDGVTANDPGDADSGANNLQNFPIITSAAPGSTIVAGTLNSTPSTQFTLDFYANGGACNASTEGQRYLGSGSVLTDAAGNASFNVTLPENSIAGESITATATDPSGNTSELSGCQVVASSANLSVTTSRTPTDPLIGSTVTYTLTVLNNGPLAATGVTLIDTLPAATSFVSANNPACAHAAGVVTCNLGALASGASVVLDIVVTADAAEPITNSASVSAAELDPIPADNVSEDTAMVSAYGSCTAASFAGPFIYTTDGFTPAMVVSGDFNEDGFADVLGTEQTDNTVALMLGDGTGAFPTVTHIPAGTVPLFIATGDFNADDHLDFVVSSNTANLYQLLGNGDGSFQAAVAVSLPFVPSGVLAADLNHDGDLDLVASPQSGGNVAVRLGDGVGGYGAATTFPAGTAPSRAVLGDFNGDTHLDIAVPNVDTSTVSILAGDGSGLFGTPVPVTLPGSVQRVLRVDDVSGDNVPDLAVAVSVNGADDNLYLLINDGAGGFGSPVEVVGPQGVVWAAAGDLNKDGTRDLVALLRDAEAMVVLHGTGAGGFAAATTYIAPEVRNHFEIADLNGDGRLDILGPSGEPSSIFVFLNTCASTEVADLSIDVTGPTTGVAGDEVTLTMTVTNHGPATATDVLAEFTGTLPAEFISTTCPATERLNCGVASLAPGASASFELTVRLYGGTGFATASVTSRQADPDLDNNSDSLSAVITPGPLTFVVTNTLDNYARGSLRYAIEESNKNTGATNTITFNIGAPGSSHTFAPQSPLEAVTNPVVIDGWTQGGTGYTGPPLIEINGAALSLSSGFFINGGGATVRGFAITGFTNGSVGIILQGNGGNVIQGNYIGVNLAGNAAKPNQTGIIVQAPNTIIGGATAAERNVISGNTGIGLIVGAATSGGFVTSSGQGSTVLGNYIGLNATGTAAIANNSGVSVQAPNVTVGTPAAGNVISGNTNTGLTLSSVTLPGTVTAASTPHNVLIQNNRIGTNALGTAALANGTNGIAINAGTGVRVGGGTANTGNLISGNTTNGILLSFQSVNLGGVQTYVGRSEGVIVEGNTIGLNLAGTAAIANQTGVRVGSPNALIGDTAAGAGNVIAGNTIGGGIVIQRSLLLGNPVADGAGARIMGNLIGTNAAGSATIGNGGNGVSITDVSDVIVGSTSTGRNVIARNTNGVSISGANVAVTGIQVRGNYIGLAPDGNTARGNTQNGVNLSVGTGSIAGTVINQNVIAANNHGISSNRGGTISVTGNRIGTNAAGNQAVGNSGYGVTLTGVSNSVIGGTSAAGRNVISGNGLSGVTFFATTAAPTSNNTIAGNYIGTNAAGTAAIPNALSGVNIAGTAGAVLTGHVIGSVGGGANIISGNLGNGVTIAGPADNIRIAGNLIGLDSAGTGALGNSNSGISLINGTTSTTIGGTSPGEGNIISGNGTATVAGNGIFVSGGGSHVIQGNWIGVNAFGTAAIRNIFGGVRLLNSNDNLIGGTSAAARNLISGNGAPGAMASGVILEGTSTNNVVQGNYIGTNPSGLAPFANFGHGVEISASNNTIGGTAAGAGNIIAFNTIDGVAVDAGTGNAIRGNSIHSNGAIGIDLNANGATANDAADADGGANNQQNFPIIASAAPGSTIVSGSLNTAASTTFTLDFFANVGCGASTQGQRYLGSAVVATDVAGNGSFNVTLPANSAVGESITATATDPNNNTSEFSACVAVANPQSISLALVGTQVVGRDRTAPLLVSLAQPAPAGGVVVAIASDDTNLVTVAAPGAVTIPEGQSSGQINLTGVNVGVTTLRANAAGYPEATLPVTVTLNVITTPTTLTVPLGQTTQLSISIPNPAPAGGLVFDVTSANLSVIEVVTPQVTVPAGAIAVNATVRGAGPGTAAVTVSRANFASSTTSVTSTSSLNIVEASASFAAGFAAPTLTIRLESDGTPVAAPSDLVVSLTPANSGCISVAATVTIPAGQVSASFVPAYGGSAALPCTTVVSASAAGPTSDTVSVTANPAGPITAPGTQTVGAGLQTFASAILGASQHGGVPVTVTSSDPSKVRLSPNASTAGSGSIVIDLENGFNVASFTVQAIENTTGSATVTLSAPGFTSDTFTVNVVPIAVQLIGAPTSTTSLSAESSGWYVRVGIPSADNQSLTTAQSVRAGGPPLVVTLTNSNAAVAQLRSDEPPTTGQVVTKPIQPTEQNTSAIVGGTSFGLAFDPLGGGTTTLTLTGPAGVGTVPATPLGHTVTVTAPGIAMPGTLTVGAGLQVGTSVQLDGSQHGGVAVTLTSSDPAKVRLSPDASTAGSGSIVINLENGFTVASFTVQGIENTTGSATITVSAPGFTPDTFTVHTVPIAVQLIGAPTSTTSLSPESAGWYVRVGIPSANNESLTTAQNVRAGGPPFVVTLTNSNAAVAQLRSDEPPTTGQVVTKPIQPNAQNTSAIVGGTSFGLAFDPVGGGTTTLTLTGPPGVGTVPVTPHTVTVTAPGISMPANLTVGAGLQLGTSVQLDGSQHGGVAVTVTSSDPSKVRLSASATTAGSGSIVIDLENGFTVASFTVQGMENTTGSATITVSAPGFTPDTFTVTVAPTAVQLIGAPTSTTSLSAESAGWYVRVGIASANNQFLTTAQNVRAGGPPFVVTLSNSNAAVAQLRSDEPATTDQVVTKPIQPNAQNTSAIVGGTSFGLAFDPLGGGTTTLTLTGPPGVGTVPATPAGHTVTVTAPAVLTQGSQTVGAGLQVGSLASLEGSQHGGVDVTVSSSAPGVLLVSPNATTPGTASFVVHVANGSTNVPFVVQALENITGSAIVSVSAPGFTTGTVAMTVVPAAIDILGLPASVEAASGESAGWYVRVGIANAGQTGLTTAQNVRFGGPAFVVTINNSNAAVAELRSDEPVASGQVVTKPIHPNEQNTSAVTGGTSFGLSFKPLGSGSTTVAATGPAGVISVTTATRTVTVNGVPTVVSIVATDSDASEAGPTTGTFTITRSVVTAQSLNVTFARSGSATPGADFANVIFTTASIPPNQASVTLTVTPLADQEVEGAETVTVTLTDTAAYDLGASAQATVTIADDPTVVSIEAIDPDASETGVNTGRFRISRSGGSTAALTVSYTRSGTAAAGTDYNAFPATAVNIPAGQSFVEITVTPIVNSPTNEPAETVTLTLAPTIRYILGATNEATVTIAADGP